MIDVTVEDVTALNTFPKVGASAPNAPKVPTEDLERWIGLRSSELELSMKIKGIEVPVLEPEQLVDLLKLAVTYGAAAMLEGAPMIKMQSGQEQNVYMQEYLRIKAWLEARTREELLGADLVPASSTVPAPPTLALARNKGRKNDCVPWYDVYPVILRNS